MVRTLRMLQEQSGAFRKYLLEPNSHLQHGAHITIPYCSEQTSRAALRIRTSRALVMQLPGVEGGVKGLCTSGMRLHGACMLGILKLYFG